LVENDRWASSSSPPQRLIAGSRICTIERHETQWFVMTMSTGEACWRRPGAW
jgi:hypothetical protein